MLVGAAADNNKVFAYYSGAFQKMKRIIKGSSRMLGHELRLRNGKFVFLFHHDLVPLFLFSIAHSITVTHSPLLNYLHCGIIAEPMVAESLYLISSCAFLSPANPRVGHLGCTVLCTFRQHDRSHPRWCEGAINRKHVFFNAVMVEMGPVLYRRKHSLMISMGLSQEQQKRYSDACYHVHGLSQEQQKRGSDACYQVHGIGWVELVVSCWTALIAPFVSASDRTI
jgi:hypothetical protein